ncbi:YbaB/EbfC family nucleoid-associated protein [Nonomuraea dietziae]|uniref:YbaB/EbfC family nucleoid-associated protein n=1 Tax=Nonomuraea dietziae TaxID=65515 RepID=UPI0031DD3EE1
MESLDEGDAAGLQAYADELRATFMRIQDEGAELHAKAKTVQVTEKSRDGLVSVTVGSRGELVRLDIDPRVLPAPGHARGLADSITETVRRAAAQVQERITELFAPLSPPSRCRRIWRVISRR